MARGAEPGRVSLLESLLMGGPFMGRHSRTTLDKLKFPHIFLLLMRSTWQDQQELNCCQMGWGFQRISLPAAIQIWFDFDGKYTKYLV